MFAKEFGTDRKRQLRHLQIQGVPAGKSSVLEDVFHNPGRDRTAKHQYKMAMVVGLKTFSCPPFSIVVILPDFLFVRKLFWAANRQIVN